MSSQNPILEELQKDYVRARSRRRTPNPEETVSHLDAAQAAVEHAAMRLAELRSSKLVTALAAESLGALLTDIEVGHVTALIRSLEEPRRALALGAPREREANGNGTRQTGAQKQVTT